MIKIIKNIFLISSLILFVILITTFYFSEKNRISTNKSRSIGLSDNFKNIEDLPILKNDTDNIIVYSDDVENFKKNKKKYKFFELIKKINQ